MTALRGAGKGRHAATADHRQNGHVPVPGLKGQLLVATPLLREPTFARTVIAMLEHDDTAGAVGIVLNRPLGVSVDEVVPSVAAIATAPALLFDGGPVSPTTAIALGLVPADAPGEGWSVVAPSLATVDLDVDVDLLATSLSALRVFAGYAGW